VFLQKICHTTKKYILLFLKSGDLFDQKDDPDATTNVKQKPNGQTNQQSTAERTLTGIEIRENVWHL
jgi:hypothetical protein